MMDGRCCPRLGCALDGRPETSVLAPGFDGFGPGKSPFRTLSPIEGPCWASPSPEVTPGVD